MKSFKFVENPPEPPKIDIIEIAYRSMMKNVAQFLIAIIKNRISRTYILNPDVVASKNKADLEGQLNIVSQMLEKEGDDEIIENLGELSNNQYDEEDEEQEEGVLNNKISDNYAIKILYFIASKKKDTELEGMPV